MRHDPIWSSSRPTVLVRARTELDYRGRPESEEVALAASHLYDTPKQCKTARREDAAFAVSLAHAPRHGLLLLCSSSPAQMNFRARRPKAGVGVLTHSKLVRGLHVLEEAVLIQHSIGMAELDRLSPAMRDKIRAKLAS